MTHGVVNVRGDARGDIKMYHKSDSKFEIAVGVLLGALFAALLFALVQYSQFDTYGAGQTDALTGIGKHELGVRGDEATNCKQEGEQ